MKNSQSEGSGPEYSVQPARRDEMMRLHFQREDNAPGYMKSLMYFQEEEGGGIHKESKFVGVSQSYSPYSSYRLKMMFHDGIGNKDNVTPAANASPDVYQQCYQDSKEAYPKIQAFHKGGSGNFVSTGAGWEEPLQHERHGRKTFNKPPAFTNLGDFLNQKGAEGSEHGIDGQKHGRKR